MPSADSVISVSQLNRLARMAIEKSLPSCWVNGEISNLTRASSGHWYFTLKDDQAAVKCAFFRNRNQFIDWIPAEGNRVEVRAQATLYEPRGDYQLLVEAMRRDGQGTLFEEFMKLKVKLEAEGLFKQEFKLVLHHYPKRIGIVTSQQAAALQDVLRTLELRWPSCPIVIYPTAVQGDGAPAMICQSIQTAISRQECDVLLLVRGGGSLEDLRAFNNEQLARTIFSSPIPIITGIGHETDFTIADFVADCRAATPTAAAQMAVPDQSDKRRQVLNLATQINQSFIRRVNQRMQQLDSLVRRVIHPGAVVTNSLKNIAQIKRRLLLDASGKIALNKQTLINAITLLDTMRPNFEARKYHLNQSTQALKTGLTQHLASRHAMSGRCADALKQLNPENVLSRGYSITLDESNKVIRSTHHLRSGSRIKVVLKSGSLAATVNEITPASN